MGVLNGYFRVIVRQEGTFLELNPPRDGGQPVELEELREYLVLHGFEVDPVVLNSAIERTAEKSGVFKLSSTAGFPVAESFKFIVSENRMQVIARFYPPSNDGSEVSKAEVLNDLKLKNIKHGVKENVIDEFLSDKKYCTDYIVAEGTAPIEGKDGFIDYKFNTDNSCKPKLNDDGTVDFFNLDLISPCTVGQELAVLTKADLGEPGTNVFGDLVKPRDVKRPVLKYGHNISINGDQTVITSLVDGNVSLVGDRVFVSNVYEVNDVDTSTGNIEYNGDVRVLGNVKAGFVVQADGSVEVKGVVEGAMIEAGKDIIITRGMNGMGKGILKAGNNIVSKFIENSNVTANGYVHSEAILHSKIQAGGDVVVTGKKGFITGGVIRSLGSIEAKTIGSTMGVDTEVEVGTDPTLKIKAQNLQQAIVSNNAKLEKIKPVLVTLTQRVQRGDKLTADQLKYIKQLSEEYKNIQEQIARDSDSYNEYLDSMDDNQTDSSIRVSDFVYPGTKITISDVSTVLKSPAQHSRFVKEGADIRIKAY